MVLKNRFNIT